MKNIFINSYSATATKPVSLGRFVLHLILLLLSYGGGPLFAQSLGTGSYSQHSSAVSADGKTYTWGNNQDSQLGNNNISNSNVPIDISSIGALAGKTISSLANGSGHTVALATDGTVYAWGVNNFGQLGDGSTTNSATPVQVPGLSYVKAIAAGEYHTLALKDDGTVYAWGFGLYGQLGNGTYYTSPPNGSSVPLQVPGLSEVKAIAAGNGYSLALMNDGTVYAWGRGSDGQLGNGSTTNSATPVQVMGLSDVKAIAAGGAHSLALLNAGTVYAWGGNDAGQLGDGSKTSSTTPVQVTGLSDVKAIAAGGGHSLALKNAGTVYAWGVNNFGQLGDGSTTNSATPVQVPGLSYVKAIAAGEYHSLALKNDGTVYAWGRGNYGQLGNGSTSDRATPVQVSNLNLNSINTAPDIAPITPAVNPQAITTPFAISSSVTDAQNNLAGNATIHWGDGSSENVVLSASGGALNASHTYAAAGVYVVTIEATDALGASTTQKLEYAVVYDPSAGFVTGGGWINSPAGAYAADPSLTGKANFGFVSKYKKGATVPEGDTQFQFKAGNLNFKSTSYEWLVIAGAKAQFKGYGTINGSGDYSFMLTAIDGQVNGGGGIDKFRIKIMGSGGGVVYDNNVGSSEGTGDNAAPATALGGGSIVIHSNDNKKAREGVGSEFLTLSDYLELTNYPNPSNGKVTFEFRLPQGGAYQLDLLDLNGNRVQTLKQGRAQAGEQLQAHWEKGQAPQGLYITRLSTEYGVKSVKLIVD